MQVHRTTQINPEIARIFDDLRIKNITDKEKAAHELKTVYLKHIEHSEEILSRIQRFINSNDIGEKLGGIIAVDILSAVIQETQVISFVNKFLSVIFQQLNFNNDPGILPKISEVFGKLIKMGDTKIAQVIESDVEEAFKWLKGDNIKEVRKYAGILALKELLNQAPVLAFNKIFCANEQFQTIWPLVREKKMMIREGALEFMNEAIKQLFQREQVQKNWLIKRIYLEIKRTKYSTDPDIIHGNIIILAGFITHGRKELLSSYNYMSFEEMSDYIFSHRMNKIPYIQLASIEAIPNIARYDSTIFINNYIYETINFLLQLGNPNRGYKERTICYDTLANTFEALEDQKLKDYIPNILKSIQNELDKKQKPFCKEMIKCLEVLRKKLNKKFIDFIKLDNLIDSILLNGINTSSLQFLNDISSKDIDKNDDTIHYKLLMTLSLILCKEFYPIPHKSNIDGNNIQRFLTNLKVEYKKNLEFQNSEIITLALNTLIKFDFQSYNEYLSQFVKDIILIYLDDENPNIRKAAAKAGCLLYAKKELNYSQLTSANNAMNDILNRFLSVCLSDPDESIKETMLESLNSNFDPFLNNALTIKKLFICFNDANFQIKEKSLTIICRLARLNSSEIVPFLKKKILQILNDLNTEIVLKEKEKIQIVDLLSRIINHAEGIIEPHTDIICHTILKLLNDSKSSNMLVTSCLGCIKELSNRVKKKLMNYIEIFFPILIQGMQDMSYTPKREVSLQAMIYIIKNTGFVIIPYYKYSSLLDTILSLIRNETSIEARKELLRLIGALGAIDYFYYKKIGQKLSDPQNRLSLDELLIQDLKTTFHILKYLRDTLNYKNKYRADLYKFYDEIIILYDLEKNTKARYNKLISNNGIETNCDNNNHYKYYHNKHHHYRRRSINSRHDKKNPKYQNEDMHDLNSAKTIHEHEHDNPNNPQANNCGDENDDENESNSDDGNNDNNKVELISNYIVQKQELQELLHGHIMINLNNMDYYSTIIIKGLLKVLCDNTLNQLQDLVIEALNYISTTLKSKIAAYLDYIIPVFTYLINTDFTLRENLLHQLDKMIKLCGLSFSERYIDIVLEIILKFIVDQNTKLMSKCFETLNTIIITNKKYLKNKMEPITNKLNHLLRSYESNKDIIKYVLIIYNHLNELLDFYLENIINIITKIIMGFVQTEPETLSRFINFFELIISTCPTTIQYISKIVQSLLFTLDNYPNQETLKSIVANCFVQMMLKFKNSFVIYLPHVNSYMIKYKIMNPRYKLCIDFLLNYGNLDDFDITNDNSNYFAEVAHINPTNFSRNHELFPASSQIMPLRSIDYEALLNEFNTFNKNIKEDWIEWRRKSSLEMLKQSPYPVLFGCHSVAESYPPLAKELYNIAFVSCWGMLNNQQKEKIIRMLNYAIQHQNIPINILQTILNLAEFMQHDREVIPIDISVLGDLAERCMAFAKALYYRELEFEVSPESIIESLITLYSNLGHTEAANGLLVYAKNTLNIELKMSWYENLQRWEDAYEAYKNNAKNDPNCEDFFVNRMRCLSAMSDWEILLSQCESVLESDHVEDIEKKKQVAHLAANAALYLNQWDKLELYTEKIVDENTDKNFFKGLISIKKNKFEESQYYIDKSREVLDNKVTGLLLESYKRAYENIIKLQQLTEMEEILEYKREEQSIYQKNERLHGILLEKDNEDNELDETYTNGNQFNTEISLLKNALLEKWNDRLNGCYLSVDVWQKILSVRSVLFNKYENLDAWVKFTKLCRKDGRIQMCKRTLDQIQKDISKIITNEDDLPPRFVLANIECEYAMGIINTNEIVDKISNYLDTAKNADHVLKSKYFLKLGLLTKQQRDEISEATINESLHFYKRSITYQNNNYKAWHLLGLINFEAVEYYENINLENKLDVIIHHVVSALKGFVKAISYGFARTSSSKTLQDLLRLLTLWFKYGDNTQISQIIHDSFDTLDIICWIDVIPQLIARFDIPNKKIQGLIHTLLMKIGHNHPQALIYPLTVSFKEKSKARRLAAEKILGDMKTHSPNLVSEALVISDELCRTAILLKELWSDVIDEAYKLYMHEKNYEMMTKTLLSMHEITRKQPETLSEITFCQSFKWEISEAEIWLLRFKDTREENCLLQAWDIYHQLFKKINEGLPHITTIHLENVSQKLLMMKNCDISVPGLYRPNKPIIRISGFAPKLPVLPSKQRPRKLAIYGSDEKDYYFLLKGREDIRQDERVMQFFSLCNKILATEPKTSKKDLNITRYSVIPLSTKAGLIGWVENCDTLQQLIKEYRENYKIIPNTEQKLIYTMCQNYEILPLANKVEIFRYVMDNTRGEDLRRVLWLKSPNSETWLEIRTNYTRSLATMSIVGYILGLGDRHPSNIMIQRMTGKIIHIDFGDCFEVAMIREKFPEKIPFRLTRMLVKAMEACSIEGIYRSTCEAVMKVLRDNSESLIAVMQSFVYDPLLNWRLLMPSDANPKADNTVGIINKLNEKKELPRRRFTSFQGIREIPIDMQGDKKKERNIERKASKYIVDADKTMQTEILNQRALEVIDRIKKKLSGKDFKDNESLNVVDQVNNLIKQATSIENICQAYTGWCPFW